MLKRRVLNSYRNLSLLVRLQAYQRWLGAPFLQVEKYVPKKGLITDLGCGLGVFSHLLAVSEIQRNVVGVDFDRQRVRLAQKTEKRNNLKFIFGDLKFYSLKKSSAIILFDVLHHVNSDIYERLLKKCYVALEENGILLIEDVVERPIWKYALWRSFESVALALKITKGDELQPPNKNELMKKLGRSGFNVRVVSLDSKRIFPHILYLCTKS